MFKPSSGFLTDRSFAGPFCKSCLLLAFVILFCLFLAALWSPAGIGLTSWLLFVMFSCAFFGVLGQVWCLIVSIPDLCLLLYFYLCSIVDQWHVFTVLPVKSDSDIIFCLQNYRGLIIERSLVY